MATHNDHRRMGLKAVGIAGFVCALPLLATATCGRSFLYHPTQQSPKALEGEGWREERVTVGDDLEVVGLVKPASQPGAPWLLFFGGNAMGIGSSKRVLDQLAEGSPWGLAVFAYRGYDGSDGDPTEEALSADSEKIAAHLNKEHGVKGERLVLVGQSLGTGVAAHLAARLSRSSSGPRALVWLAPYTSMADVFDEHVPLIPVGWVAPDMYRTESLTDALTCSVLIVHGRDDTLIPIDHSRRLAAQLGSNAKLVELEGREHNDLWSDPRTVAEIRRFVRNPHQLSK